jgi:hypothetical protein
MKIHSLVACSKDNFLTYSDTTPFAIDEIYYYRQ